MTKYPAGTEQLMQNFYASLSEKEKRRYAAIEAIKLGYGGKSYICGLLGCDYKTLVRGVAELQDEQALAQKHIRQAGGGRKRIIDHAPGIEEAFLRVIESYTAGSPMNEEVKWTNLTREQLAQSLTAEGFKVSVTVVDQLLAKYHFRRRQAFKVTATGQAEQRDEQFQKFERLKEAYQALGNPVLSMDSKKKS